MYNLLISGNLEAWETGFYEFELSRVLEYTNSTVVEKFDPISKNIGKLVNFPCLFGYEGREKPYKFGYIKEIRVRDKRVRIKYSIFNSIPFNIIRDLSTSLDIRDWEINRTHWAVKDEDLINVFHKQGKLILDVYKENLSRQESDSIKKFGGKIKIVGEKSETSSTLTGFIQKINDLDKKIKKESIKNNEKVIFYRGHSNKIYYKLVPSLFRRDEDGNYLYLNNEEILYKELLVSNFVDFEKDNCTLDKLVRMQHYSLPTRLLDITSNPLIALYFACKSNMNDEGEVIVFAVNKSLIKYFDSDTASCIANLCRLDIKEKNKIEYNKEIEEFNEQSSIQKLLHYIREEKPFFLPKIQPTHLKNIICIKSKMTNNRIVSQSGAFLLFGSDAIMDENGDDDISLYRISIPKKEQILEELDRLNINDRTVFPYIENSAKYIRDKYSFQKNSNLIE